MIGSGFYDAPEHSNVTIYCYTATTGSNYPPYNYSILLPAVDDLPKRKIPFYRALFDQSFPVPKKPVFRDVMRSKWRPNMGRVTINRTSPK